MSKPRVIAIVPARAGSKRLLNKNLLSLAGKPLIAWSIEAGLNASCVDDVIVSTDCESIARAAKEYGACVPFLRPGHLADDSASTDDVIMHAVEMSGLSGEDIIIVLQPTSPLRDASDIQGALAILSSNGVKGVVSVCECEHSPLWSNVLPDSQRMGGFIGPELASKRSQDLPIYYRLNGAIYAYRVSYLEKHGGRYYSDDIQALIMPASKSIDIDNQIDFDFAEFLLTQNPNNRAIK